MSLSLKDNNYYVKDAYNQAFKDYCDTLKDII